LTPARLRIVLLGDGESDQALLPVALWRIRAWLPSSVITHSFETHGGRDLDDALASARQRLRPNVVLIHRDAEKEPLADASRNSRRGRGSFESSRCA